jgi:branched-chain amino acid transport system permease protein
MDIYLQQLFNGIVLGSEYALLAVGLVLVFSVLRVLNFAHGAIFAWGGLGAILGFELFGGNAVAISLLSAIAVGAAIALVTHYGVMEPLHRKGISGHLVPAVATIGVSWMLVGFGQVLSGSEPRTYPSGAVTTSFHDVGPIQVSYMQLAIIATALGALGALDAVVFRTRLGRHLRAVAHEPENAELLGVDVSRIRAATFVISGAFAGLAGALTTLSIDLASPFIAEGMLIKGFAIIVLAGMGSVRGAVIGAMLLGVAEVMSVQLGYSPYRDAVAGALLFAVLMLRPSGLFGTAEVQRA